ncbi:MAG: class I SAM-dependent methyltransferase [Anaerolineales bacterium]|nr:class I SAM-dependent methyltransferase [Anaerolineales bacterium]
MKIYEYMEVTRGVTLTKDFTVIDLGCGQGIWTMELAKKCGKTIGVDVLEDAVKTARQYIRNSTRRKRLEFFNGSLDSLGIRDASIDHIFSFCVLEHIQDLENTLNSSQRLLRSGGGLHVSVDALETITDKALKAKHKLDHKVVQYFSAESLKERLENAGFNVQRVFPILTGSVAMKEFKKRIEESSYGYGWFERKLLVQKFFKEDRQGELKKGIMIVAHATRP